MLTLILTVALCDVYGCTYLDRTSTFPEIQGDTDCVLMAAHLNRQNVELGEDIRFACLEPKAFHALAEKNEL